MLGLDPNAVIWVVAAVATCGVIFRPWRVPEYVWALSAAALLTGFGFIPWPSALAAIAKGTDVYLFLIGMMVLAELARKKACSTGWRCTPHSTPRAPVSGYSIWCSWSARWSRYFSPMTPPRWF